MTEVTIGGREYELVPGPTHDLARTGGQTDYYREKGTTEWHLYKPDQSGGTNIQVSSSSDGTVPAQYSNRLPSHEYQGEIGGIPIGWGPGAEEKLIDEWSGAEVPLYTIKALCEHFVYLMVVRVRDLLGENEDEPITSAVISAPSHEFAFDTATEAESPDAMSITVSLKPGGRKAYIHLSGIGEGATACNNMEVRGESIITKQGGFYTLNTNLSYGYNTSMGTFAAQTPATTTTTASGHTVTASDSSTAGGHSTASGANAM